MEHIHKAEKRYSGLSMYFWSKFLILIHSVRLKGKEGKEEMRKKGEIRTSLKRKITAGMFFTSDRSSGEPST